MAKLILDKVGLPPVLPDLKDLIEEYLLVPDNLPIHDPVYGRKFWPRTPDPTRLYNITPSPLKHSLEVERDPATGNIIGLKEIKIADAGATSKDSFSMRREPGPLEEMVRGSSTNYPFWPGGFEDFEAEDLNLNSNSIDFENNLLQKHPLLSRGINFDKSDKHDSTANKTEYKEVHILNINEMLKVDEDVFSAFEVSSNSNIEKLSTLSDSIEEQIIMDNTAIIEPEKKVFDVIKISEGPIGGGLACKGTEWAEIIDAKSSVDNFHHLAPNPACSYPFELDIFQKQAILYLEKHECVFVAAHTSAGKTVVAEYAIALSLKHMTRAIYTSPIKALSNQKYRDLKVKFEDVGLLTGDIQINPKASCLIMTTEILQSMLYNGSDIIRDLEWVIFDEVHYINNAERGHVWEEVIIMLPSHVNIVLLSATVPNTLEFADWIGRIKKRKIYVISTTKRPVPLEHYLYAGIGSKGAPECFMIVNSNGDLVRKGYNDAVEAKKGKSYGAKQGSYRQSLGEKQEKNLWISLISYLSKKDLLPVVAFTLSKNRCDQNAMQLESQDLTNKREKGEIHTFIKKCIERLQGSDRELPQVIHMTKLLSKGIGVHHSGILPILKEVIEMLFAKGLVKLLFATETFAMGVNMPARCVLFDSIRKHDGQEFRELLPSEYIQMAGRAGRRGLDTTGTVLILCKTGVPDLTVLQKMMLGKPTKLESQFKLTYSMILNLLRIEALRVEDMMKRSFSESLQLKKQSQYAEELKDKMLELEKLPDIACMMCKGIEQYYSIAKDFIENRKNIYQLLTTHSNSAKFLQAGRILCVNCDIYVNVLACILKVDARDKTKLTIFILKDSNVSMLKEEIMAKECIAVKSDMWFDIDKTMNHDIIEITPKSITGISNKAIKIDGTKIIDNVKKRQMPRFQDEPPSQSVMEVIQELNRLNDKEGEGLIWMDLQKDCGIKELRAVEKILNMKKLRERLLQQPCLECPQFTDHFLQSFKKLHTREKIGKLKYLMSEEALQLHPEYQMRVEVLKMLGYIEANNTVTLKGRVACEMGNHELMVTELMLENVFAEKPVEEVTALLSSLVFQQRNVSECELSEELIKGVNQFRDVARKIGEAQKASGLKEPVEDFVDQFNFGLTEVVFHWSGGIPFDKIMEFTEVQEGIVVKCIQRLDETLRDVRNAARIIGDPNLYEKMEKASVAIKRDIVFAASLYTQ